jgi:hypothetical protein
LNWIPSGSAQYLVQPPSGQLTTGWVGREAPPFRFANWTLYIIDQWIQYLDSTAGSASPTAVVTTGSTNSTITLTVASTIGVLPGMTVSSSASDIAAGTMVLKIINPTTLQMTGAATGTNAGSTITFSHTVASGTTVQTQLDELDAELAYSLNVCPTTAVNHAASPYAVSTAVGTGDCGKTFLIDTGSGTFQFNLPAAPYDGFFFFYKDETGNAAANHVTLHPSGIQTVENAGADFTISTAFASGKVVWNAITGNWAVIGGATH